MRKILTILALFISFVSFAQLENANWCLPYRAQVSFNTGSPSPGYCANINNVFLDGYGTTCASVSNSAGDLLFYSDGVRVWDQNGDIMTHGVNIGGGSGTGWSEQGVIIVPKPGSETIYYIFTTCKFAEFPPPNQNHTGFHYSIVDMSLRGGNGDVVEFTPGVNHIPLKDDGPNGGNLIDYDYATNTGLQTYESSITSALNRTLTNTIDGIWVTLFARFHESGVVTREAYSYLVKADGINHTADGTSPVPNKSSPLVIRCALLNPICSDYGGSIKISPDGAYLCNESKDVVDLYTFNNVTGEVIFDHTVFPNGTAVIRPGYGIEFSPNSSLIYFSSWECGLCQEKPGLSDITGIGGGGGSKKNYIRIRQAKVIPQHGDSAIIIGEFEVPGMQTDGSNIIPLPGTTYGELQLAPDGKIYACAFEPNINPPSANLGFIRYPDVPGVGCTYVNNGVSLAWGTEQYGSLPQWVHKATVNTIWPKVYDAGSTSIMSFVDINSGSPNVFFGLERATMINNVNHSGYLPTQIADYTVQYNKSTGITSWANQNMQPLFVLSSGDIQVRIPTSPFTAFYNGSTGLAVVSPLSSITNGEYIIAEDNGTFITQSGTNFKVHSSMGTTTEPFFGNYIMATKTIYNPVTKKLFVNYHNNSSGLGTLAVYSLNNNILTLINTPVINSLGVLIQVDNTDKVYVLAGNQGIDEYNYTANIFTPLTISGFSNSNLRVMSSSNPYADDKLLVMNEAEKNIYYINTSFMQAKKISFAHAIGFFPGAFIFDGGNDVYISGLFEVPPSLTIGNQSMPLLGVLSGFITKFNIQTDFSFRSYGENNFKSTPESLKIIPLSTSQINTDETVLLSTIEATISPNPAKNSLIVNFKQKGNGTASSFLISITNILGVEMFKQNTPQKMLTVDVSQFKTGIYYVTISTDNGDRITKMFMKE